MEPFGTPRVSVAASANPLNHYTNPEDEGAQTVHESSRICLDDTWSPGVLISNFARFRCKDGGARRVD